MEEDIIYDFVIIGSGLGGLECAYILADEGYSVAVLEKNHQIGGNLQVFSRDKRIFDTGVHYIGNMDEGELLHKVFNYFNLTDSLKWTKMNEDCFDMIRFEDGKEYKLAQGYDRFKKNLLESFPEEEEAIDKYIAKIQEVCQSFPLYNLRYDVAEDLLAGDKNELLFQNLAQYLDSITDNERLKHVLAGNSGLYAGVKSKTPIYVHALITDSFIKGAYRLKDGGSQIAIQLSRGVRQRGGKILKRKDVVGANYHENGHVKEVVLADGETVKGKNFISNVHPAVTIDIFGDERFLKPYRKRIRGLENTMSTFNVYLSLEEDTFEYLDYNIYKVNDDPWSGVEYTEDNWGKSLYICTPASSKSEEYADSMIIMSYMRYDEVKQWETSQNTVARPGERGEEYAKFKREKEEQIIDEVEKIFPGIRSKIRTVHSSSPLTLRDYIGDKEGALYGIIKDCNSPARSLINSSTKVPNLYLTGQNLILHGIVGVTIGAFVTCFNFLNKKELMDKVTSAEKVHVDSTSK